MNRFVSGIALFSALSVATSCAHSQSSQQINSLSAEQRGQGWSLLFDGRSLEGWTNRGMAEWRVVDGALVPTPGTGPGHLATNRSYGNFQLGLEFYVDSIVNSGVYFRVPATEAATVDNSFEVQIFDAGPVWQTGSIVNVQAALEKVTTAGKWNTMDVTAAGTQLTVLVNGRKIADADVREAPRLASGPIILSPGQGDLRFRNIRIRRL